MEEKKRALQRKRMRLNRKWNLITRVEEEIAENRRVRKEKCAKMRKLLSEYEDEYKEVRMMEAEINEQPTDKIH